MLFSLTPVVALQGAAWLTIVSVFGAGTDLVYVTDVSCLSGRCFRTSMPANEAAAVDLNPS